MASGWSFPGPPWRGQGIYGSAFGSASAQEAQEILARPWAEPVSTFGDVKAWQRLEELAKAVDSLREQIRDRPIVYGAQIHDLGDPRYSLRCPLIVTMEAWPDEVVARLPEFDLYATGASDAVAVMNLKAEIVGTYERLEDVGPDKLGPMALQWLATLRRIIEPAHE